MARQSAIRNLRRALDRRERNARIVYPYRVQGRNSDGTLNILRLDGECVERTRKCTKREGEMGVVPCGAPPDLQGATGIGLARGAANAAICWVESLDPPLYSQGSSYTVDVVGRGFTEEFDIDFLLPGTETIHPGITKDEVRFMTSVLVEVDITIAADAEPIDASTGDIAYENVGATL